jgi:hypothetical protein
LQLSLQAIQTPLQYFESVLESSCFSRTVSDAFGALQVHSPVFDLSIHTDAPEKEYPGHDTLLTRGAATHV